MIGERPAVTDLDATVPTANRGNKMYAQLL